MNAYVVIVIVSLIGTIIYDLWQKNKTDKKRNEIMNCILSMMKEKNILRSMNFWIVMNVEYIYPNLTF